MAKYSPVEVAIAVLYKLPIYVCKTTLFVNVCALVVSSLKRLIEHSMYGQNNGEREDMQIIIMRICVSGIW